MIEISKGRFVNPRYIIEWREHGAAMHASIRGTDTFREAHISVRIDGGVGEQAITGEFIAPAREKLRKLAE